MGWEKLTLATKFGISSDYLVGDMESSVARRYAKEGVAIDKI
jgi:hypothetical protein